MASLPLWAGFARLAFGGWTPTGDEAVIAWRAWDVFTSHAPLVGQYTQASGQSGQAVFDPGPLLYWALAVPVRIAPRTGALLGVVCVDTLALVAACVAAAQTRGRIMATVVAGGSLVGCWTLLNYLLAAPVWNPYAALVPFGALLPVAWAVASGRLGWWPVALVLASYVTQAHLMYAPASLALCVATPALGMLARRSLRRPIGFGWALGGIGAFVACWAVPLWQQFTNRPGNLTLLWRSALSHKGATLGWHSALSDLGSTTLPTPIWLRNPHFGESYVPGTANGSVVWALMVLLALGGVVAWAARCRRPGILALAAVALLTSLGSTWAIAGIARDERRTELYIKFVMWPAGMVAVLGLAYPLVTAAWPWFRDDLARRRDARPGPLLLHRPGPRTALAGLAACLTIVLSVAVTGVAVANAPDAAQIRPGQSQWLSARAARTLVREAGKPAHRGQRLTVRTDPSYGFAAPTTSLAAGYQLVRRGWTPAIETPWNQVLIGRYHARPEDLSIWLAGVQPAPGAVAVTRIEVPTDTGTQEASVWVDPPLAGARP